jgi:hypothetical protein
MNVHPSGPLGEMLSALQKAVTTSTITDLVKEDLEARAHSTLWKASKPTELTLLKLCPSIEARSIKHEYDRVTSYGEERGNGWFGEQTLPLETAPSFSRHQTFIRLLGEMSSTFLLASLESNLVSVDGQKTAESIGRRTLMLNLMKKKNHAMYFSDTSKVRTGATAQRFQGLRQQIREGTDGTTGTSVYGSHEIDMEGQPLTAETIREKIAKIISLFGYATTMIMDPFSRADFEASLDPAQRLPIPAGVKPIMVGQNVGGITTQGGQVMFHTDNTLTPLYAQKKYKATAMSGAPSRPSVTGAVGAPGGSRTSKFNATDAGNYFWIITEVKDDRESLGYRWPVSGTQAVAAGEEVTLTITPADPYSDSFRIYRSISSDDASTDLYCIDEAANSGSGAAVAYYDGNHERPGTSCAFLLSINSDSADDLNSAPSGSLSSYSLAAERSEKFLGQEDREDNTVTMVNLGPAMGVMQLATILATTARPLLYSACAMQVRNPFKNFVFKNIGSNYR